jgi:pimeloyl-ACP methyl ester carboxylesterase
MSSFLLIHGAWHGGWCLERVAQQLEQRGHRVRTPTLVGLGERANELHPAIGLQQHVRDVVDALERAPEPVVLVGHSYGGLVARDAALRKPEQVSELVLVEAWIGPEGRGLLDLAPAWFADGIRRAADERGAGWRIPVPDPAVVGVSDPADAAWLRRCLTEHPLKTFTDPARLGNGGTVSMRAILGSPGPVPFEDMAAALRIPSVRIEGGHDLMVTSPRELAGALLVGNV